MRFIFTRLPMVFVALVLTSPIPACSEDDGGPRGDMEPRDHIRVIWLRGTPYEMGLQHAELLYDELVAGREFIDDDFLFSTMLSYSNTIGLDEVAEVHSYEATLDECQGMVDGLDGSWTLHECLILNYGDVIMDILKLEGLGCSQFVAAGAATASGDLIHGRNLDWWEVGYIEQNPVIFVREPADGIPWVAVGFPANMSPYTGMSAAGIAVASNEVGSPLDSELAREGRSHVQMVREVLRTCSTLQEAEAFFVAQDHASAEILVVSDGPGGEAAALEMTAHSMAARHLSADGVLLATNHFKHPDMEAAQEPEPECTSTWNRYERLTELLEPTGAETRHGSLTVEGAIAILRDTYDPCLQEFLDPGLVDGGSTLANNGAMQSVVFLPARGLMYVAVGDLPTTILAYQGFDIHELLTGPGYAYPDPASYPQLSF